MNEITRFIEVDSEYDYVIPAINLKEYEGKIHIGLFKDDHTQAACFCGQHHKQANDVWNSPSVDDESNITCGSCIRTMRNIIRCNSSKPYKAIMEALGEKLDKAQFHKRQEGGHSNKVYVPGIPEEVSRILSGPPQDDVFQTALNQGIWPKKAHYHYARDIRIGEHLFPKIMLINFYGPRGTECHKCFFSDQKNCPWGKNDFLCVEVSNSIGKLVQFTLAVTQRTKENTHDL